jgi:hypothetical protein
MLVDMREVRLEMNKPHTQNLSLAKSGAFHPNTHVLNIPATCFIQFKKETRKTTGEVENGVVCGRIKETETVDFLFVQEGDLTQMLLEIYRKLLSILGNKVRGKPDVTPINLLNNRVTTKDVIPNRNKGVQLVQNFPLRSKRHPLHPAVYLYAVAINQLSPAFFSRS